MKKPAFRVTSFDVAALAGVSQSAVSRAFTPGSSIAETTRSKVLDAARKLNYVPNSIASSLTTNRSRIVALILGTLDNPFYTHVFQEFSRRLQERSRSVLTFTLPSSGETDDAILRVLQYQVDAVILTSAQLSTRMIGMCQDRGIPVALFNRYVPHSDALSIRCDNVAGGRLLAAQFLAAGAKTFAMITGDPRGTTSQDRVRGFMDHLLECGIKRSAMQELPGGSSYEGGAAAIRRLMTERKGKRPDAVFGINDIMAMGALDELRFVCGLRVPDDIMVAGFDGIPEAARASYRLTSVRQPLEDMVMETLRVLGIDDDARPQASPRPATPLPCELIIGNTIARV